MRHPSLHRFTPYRFTLRHQDASCPPCLSLSVSLFLSLPVSRSHLVLAAPPSPSYTPVALEISDSECLQCGSSQYFIEAHVNPPPLPPLQPDIHSLASRLSSISRHWRCCYLLFEAAFSFRSLSPFFSLFSASFFSGLAAVAASL